VPAIRDAADPLADEATRTCALLDELLARFGDAYAELKRARAAVDFDDLELLTLELLRERESVRVAWSARFELLMVDEFQDTNARQLGILSALDRGNLFTVGDELQSIYGFRHADVSLFRARRAELEERGASVALTAQLSQPSAAARRGQRRLRGALPPTTSRWSGRRGSRALARAARGAAVDEHEWLGGARRSRRRDRRRTGRTHSSGGRPRRGCSPNGWRS